MFGRFAWVSLIVTAAACTVAKAATPTEDERLFVDKVRPILTTKCLACHGDDQTKIKGGLDLRTLEAARRGGDSEKPAIVPGKPEQSPLFLAVTRTSADWSAMPPKENDKLSANDVKVLRDWIVAGATWPDAKRIEEIMRLRASKGKAPAGEPVRTSGGLTADWTNRTYAAENLWAYRPLRKPTPPANLAGHPIDAFLNQRLAAAGVQPAPATDRRTLIRRATLDLTGLPPTPEEIQQFVNDPAPDDEAFPRVIDRLLASPHYGERWARHWLDVVRYADSSGFANDYERGNAWRYRDYVIRAFNSDKPYDRFVQEQIAGDEIDPTNPENLIAVGFLRMGPWELTSMEVAKVARQRFLDDVTDTVGQVFLAHAMQCARCHDHKFDPVPTRDYYRLQAVFATTQLTEREARFLTEENTAGFDEKQYLDRKREDYLTLLRKLDDISLSAAEQWFREKNVDRADYDQAVAQMRKTSPKAQRDYVSIYEGARGILLRKGIPEDRIPPRHYGFSVADHGLERIARKGLERLRWEYDRYRPIAISVYSGRTPDLKAVYAPQRMPDNRLTVGELEQTCILTGGDPFSPAQKVEPGALSVIELSAAEHGLPERAFPADIVGRRKALAEWMTYPSHPLTSRVMVNRIWQGHFGRPIAGNPNNFGATGKKPTHPELLDFLAATFVEKGWSIKALHRLIMTSEAYRRSTRHADAASLAKLDPNGTLYAVFHPRRLTAEEWRDGMLFLSGELNRTIGGIPARPEIHPEAAMQPRQVMGTFAAAWEPSPRPEQRHRRSIYALKIRGLRDPFLEVFNEPSPELSCEVREASTITPQVFSLFNSQATLDRAVAFATRLSQDGGDREAIINRLFLHAYGRDPTAKERELCLRHWEQMSTRHRDLKIAKPAYPRAILREAVEENTGEKFQYRETLHRVADFVPDRHISEVDPVIRGLAELCLVILNSNEFAYVY